MSVEYETPVVIGSDHWTNQWLSYGRVHNQARSFAMRTHKPNHWGGDEKFVWRGVTQYDATGRAIAFKTGNVCYGDDLYLYSVSHSIYALPVVYLEYARFAKKDNDRLSLINVCNPDDRGVVGLNDLVAICKFSATDGLRVNYLTYDDTETGLHMDVDHIEAYERWAIQSY